MAVTACDAVIVEVPLSVVACDGDAVELSPTVAEGDRLCEGEVICDCVIDVDGVDIPLSVVEAEAVAAILPVDELVEVDDWVREAV